MVSTQENLKISIIAAVSKNGVIGKKGELPWYIPEDLRHFKELTTGHPIIMGRKTFESIGKPLPNRANIIITRDAGYEAEGCLVVHSLEEALEKAGEAEKNPPLLKLRKGKSEVFVIGGGEIYNEAIKVADKLYLTLIEDNFEGDVFFPDYSAFGKILKDKPGESGNIRFRHLELERG